MEIETDKLLSDIEEMIEEDNCMVKKLSDICEQYKRNKCEKQAIRSEDVLDTLFNTVIEYAKKHPKSHIVLIEQCMPSGSLMNKFLSALPKNCGVHCCISTQTITMNNNGSHIYFVRAANGWARPIIKLSFVGIIGHLDSRITSEIVSANADIFMQIKY